MIIRKSKLSVSCFTFLCALLLATGTLSVVGVSRAYGDESPQQEVVQDTPSEDQTVMSASSEKRVVSFAGWYPDVEIEEGQPVTEPEPLSDRVITYRGKERPVVFKGWIASWYIKPDMEQRLYCANVLSDGLMELLQDFSKPINLSTEFYPMFYCPEYQFDIGVTLPDGSGSSTSIHALANDTVGSLTNSNPDYYYQLFQTLSRANGQPVEPGTEPSFLPGYTFVGWFDQYGTRFELDTPILRDTELRPKFERNGNPITSDKKDIPVQGDTGIIASGTLQGESVPEGVNVWVGASAVTAGETHDVLIAQMESGVSAGVFEVSLVVDGQQIHDGFGSLALSFPVDAKYDGHWVTVWHRHNDGSITSERVVAKDGAVAVTVTDLSTFALEIGEPEEAATTPVSLDTTSTSDPSTLAKTGDTTPVLAFGGFALAALGAVAFAGYRTRKSTRK